jgi:hypothetical protein
MKISKDNGWRRKRKKQTNEYGEKSIKNKEADKEAKNEKNMGRNI